MVDYVPACRYSAGDPHLCGHAEASMGEGNQFVGMVELTKSKIVELKFSINRKPTNMQSKVFLEAELYEKIDILICL